MKRNSLLLGLAIVLVASCSTQEKDFQEPLQGDVFYASFEQPVEEGTKVYANENLHLRWNADDRVSIFNKVTYNQQYLFAGETGDNAGEFDIVNGDVFVTGNVISHVVSVYPYQKSTVITEDEVLTVTLPAEQSYAENTFGLGANTMVSVSSDNVLQYKNVGGYLMLKLYGEGVSVSSITLKGNNGEKLAGDTNVTMPLDGVPTAMMAKNSTTEITLTCSKPVTLGATAEESTQFWFVVPPVTFEDGFTITVNGSLGGVYEKSTTKRIVIDRNKLSKMSPMEVARSNDNRFVTIEDTSFKAYCVENFDTDSDREISVLEAQNILSIKVDTDEIRSLKGIEHFHNLQELQAVPRHTGAYGVGIGEDWRNSGYTFDEYNGYNTVTIVHGALCELDLSGNPDLVSLDCSGNALTFVDLSANTKLRRVLLQYNPDLSELVLGDLKELTELNLGCTSITSINLSPLTELLRLSIDRGAEMGTVDVSNNTKLQSLGIDCRGITRLDVSHNQDLEELSCSNNRLTELDVTKNKKLTYLAVAFNQISKLDLSQNTELYSVTIQNNCISSIDVSSLPKLQFLHIGNYINDGNTPVNTVHEINLSSNPKLERLFTTILDIESIDVSDKEDLVFFDCSFNGLLQEIDVSKSLRLETLYCYSAPLLSKIFVSPDQDFNCIKDESAHFYYKGEGDSPYISSDFSTDGNVKRLQEKTKGEGINIVFMGDAFSDRLVSDGTYDRVMDAAMEAFFSVEPYRSFRDCFNVYSVNVISRFETYDGLHETALGTHFDGGTQVGGNDGTVFDYAGAVPGFDADNDIVCVVMNKEAHAGTCVMYYTFINDGSGLKYSMSNGSGAAIAYFPLGLDETNFAQLVHHEAGGHAFAKLADEYSITGFGMIPEEETSTLAALHDCGWYTNVDTVSSPDKVIWSDFLKDARYASEDLGLYEGGYLYERGVFRPSEGGIMNDNSGIYNAPSRKAIYNCIGHRAFGNDWSFDYESFAEYDAVNIPRVRSNSNALKRKGITYPRLSSPVLKCGSWKETISKSRRKSRNAASVSYSNCNWTVVGGIGNYGTIKANGSFCAPAR